jgi:hypothetical protein
MFLGGRVLSLVCMYMMGSTCSQVDGVLPIRNMYVHGGQCVPKWTGSSLPIICMYVYGGSMCSQVDKVLSTPNMYVYGGQHVPKWMGFSLSMIYMYMGSQRVLKWMGPYPWMYTGLKVFLTGRGPTQSGCGPIHRGILGLKCS